MIVVDTNVIAYLFLPSEFSAAARRVYELDSRWVAPLLWRSELRNVLSVSVQQADLILQDALEVMEAATDLMRGGEYEAPSDLVLQLAADSRCSAYDCEFVALALELDVGLVTEDRRIHRAFGDTAVRLREFTDERGGE